MDFSKKYIYNQGMKNISGKTIFAIIINLFIFVTEVVIVITNLPHRGGSALVYYTTLSNLMGMAAAFVFLWSAFSGFRALNKTRILLRFYATCMLSFTLIVVFCVLIPMAIHAGIDPIFLLTEDTALLHHVINPVLSFISFIFLEKNMALKKAQPFIMLCLTLCYAFIMLFFNIIKWVDGPYPFFQVYQYPAWMIVIWFAVLFGVSYLINFLIYLFRSKENTTEAS